MNAVCIDSVDVQLIAPVAFQIGVNAINEICKRANGSVGITAAGGVIPYSMFWDNVLLDSAGVSGLSTGTYGLKVVDANGCGVDTSINIYNEIIPPVHIMNHDTTVNIGDVFQLNAVNAIDYQWTPVDGLSCTDCASPFARPLKPVTYIVKTVTGLNCIPADTINITLTYNRSLYAPSAFSPNNDGQNDVFRVKGKGVAIYHLSVYNRWGQLIYNSNDMARGWDGFYQEKLQPVGAYVYMVQYAFYGDEKNLLMQKGAFTLIR
jgi:gliding motility-associated-like protein